jgi:hypothetical protein
LGFVRYVEGGPVELWVLDLATFEARRVDLPVEPVLSFSWGPPSG